MTTRTLTTAERARLASGRGCEGMDLTCEGDEGHGPCGTYLDWTDGHCARGHVIEVETDAISDPVCDECGMTDAEPSTTEPGHYYCPRCAERRAE